MTDTKSLPSANRKRAIDLFWGGSLHRYAMEVHAQYFDEPEGLWEFHDGPIIYFRNLPQATLAAAKADLEKLRKQVEKDGCAELAATTYADGSRDGFTCAVLKVPDKSRADTYVNRLLDAVDAADAKNGDSEPRAASR